jgi:hypothetical protein
MKVQCDINNNIDILEKSSEEISRKVLICKHKLQFL